MRDPLLIAFFGVNLPQAVAGNGLLGVLIDAPVWSELYRRATPIPTARAQAMQIIENGEARIIGPIRQEVLSGVRESGQFSRLRAALRAFPDEPIRTEDYETAANFYNRCRTVGIQGSNTDFLICAISSRIAAPILTLDRDFEAFARVLPVSLVEFE